MLPTSSAKKTKKPKGKPFAVGVWQLTEPEKSTQKNHDISFHSAKNKRKCHSPIQTAIKDRVKSSIYRVQISNM